MSPSAADERMGRARNLRLSDPNGITRLDEKSWLVRSASGRGSYRVIYDPGAQEWTCDCRDFLDWKEPCKHIFRVYFEWNPEGAPSTRPVDSPPKRQYQQDWPKYDLAQQEELRLFEVLLRALADTVQDPYPVGIRGRPPVPLPDQIFCALRKVYSQKSCRRAQGELRAAEGRGALERVPGYVVSSRFFNREDATSLLEELVTRSAQPVAGLEDGFAQDATGVQTTSFGAWREAAHDERRRKEWLKAHALVGVRTHVIVRLTVTEKNGADYNELAPMVRAAMDRGVVINEVYADKAYTGRSNYAQAEDLGFKLISPFKSTDTPRVTSKSKTRFRRHSHSLAWQKMFYHFQLHREEFDAVYHRRSNVEAVFSALKRKFGETLRSKSRRAQINEILAKAIAYNLTVLVHEIFEHGVVPDFLADPTLLEKGR